MSYIAALIKMQTLRGAIASVSLSHPEDCPCLTCKAAHGDEDAFTRLLEQSYMAEPPIERSER